MCFSFLTLPISILAFKKYTDTNFPKNTDELVLIPIIGLILKKSNSSMERMDAATDQSISQKS